MVARVPVPLPGRRRARLGLPRPRLLILGILASDLFLLGTERASSADNPGAGIAKSSPRITLAEGGRSDYRILVAGQSPLPVRFAADELQKYLKQISGAELSITAQDNRETVIVVADGTSLEGDFGALRAQLSGQGDDGYLVRSLGKRLVLAGNSPRATLYAVYHFLEKYLGCGWCAPGDDTVPRHDLVQVAALDEAVGPPAFTMRQIILFPYGGQWLKKNNLPHADWLAKNRFNWAHPAPNGPDSWERNQSRQVFVPEVKRRGLYLEVGGHTFNTWIPSDKYAAAHPEYFAVKHDGGRASDGTDVSRGGLCISNPDVVKTVADNMIRWLDENPEVDAVDLWHNDSDLYCRCPRCTPPGTQETPAEVRYTRSYVRFCNRVAELVGRRHPKTLINALAYAHTTACPPDVGRLHDQVLLGLCLFPRPSQRTMRPLETSPQDLDQKLRAQLLTWPKVAEHFYIYEYYTIGEKEKRWSMVSMICEDLRYFKRLGIQGVSSDQWGPGWYPLNMYAFAKLTWNPELTRDEIVSEFCAKYYGRSAGTMTAYWNALEEGLRESWTTRGPIDWRDQRRLDLAKKALAEADNKRIESRIRSTASLHQLVLP
jgi:hypothetical protein